MITLITYLCLWIRITSYNVCYTKLLRLNGKAALSWLERSKFDVILLDVMMPDMDGYETCKAIKSNPSNANVPIIFLTARHDIASMTAGFLAGGVDS